MKPRFADVRDRLRYVRLEREDYDLSKFPDFMVIGPQRTGTTWLGQALLRHPAVSIPWDKEIHYFNNLEHPEYHPASLPPVSQELGWYLDQFRIPEIRFARREEACQRDLGQPYRPVAFGDLTATYAAALHEGIIREIVTLNPDVKIVAMVRDPVQRAWSHAKKDLCVERGRPVKDVPEEEWLAFFGQDYQVACGNYTKFLARWEAIVPPANLLVARFADVELDPRGLVKSVTRHLGLEVRDEYIGPEIGEKVPGLNVGVEAAVDGRGIPPRLKARLDELFADEAERLRRRGLI